MNSDLHHIDDLFKSGLEGKEDSPSPAVWENIEKELDKKDSRPKFFLWWNSRKIAAAVLIVLGSAGLFAGGYYLRGVSMDNKETKLTPSENQPQPSKQAEPYIPGSVNDGENNKQSPAQRATSKFHEGEVEQENQVSQDAAHSNSEEPRVNKESVSEKAAEPTDHKEDLDKSLAVVPALSSGAKRAGPNAKEVKPASSTPSTSTVAKADNNQRNITSDKKNISANEVPADHIRTENAEIPGSWEPVDINTIPASRELAVSEKTLAAPTRTILADHNMAKTNPSAIPVLNKRTASVDLPRFALTPVIAAQFGSNRIKANNSYPNAGKVKSEIDRTESQPSRIAGGLLADLRIAKNMTVQSGLVFTSRQIEIEPKYIKAERNADGKVRYKFDCSAGTYYLKKSTYARPGDSALTIFSTNELNYINIPLAITYHFGGKNLHLFATAGAGLNLLTKQYLETGLHNYNYDEDQSTSTNLKSNYYNGTIGAGIDWRAFKKVSFLFSPQYQFGLTPMNENMPVKAYPRTFNLQIGMQIRL